MIYYNICVILRKKCLISFKRPVYIISIAVQLRLDMGLHLREKKIYDMNLTMVNSIRKSTFKDCPLLIRLGIMVERSLGTSTVRIEGTLTFPPHRPIYRTTYPTEGMLVLQGSDCQVGLDRVYLIEVYQISLIQCEYDPKP